MRVLDINEVENVSGGTIHWVVKAVAIGIALYDGAKEFFEGVEEGFKDGESKKKAPC